MNDVYLDSLTDSEKADFNRAQRLSRFLHAKLLVIPPAVNGAVTLAAAKMEIFMPIVRLPLMGEMLVILTGAAFGAATAWAVCRPTAAAMRRVNAILSKDDPQRQAMLDSIINNRVIRNSTIIGASNSVLVPAFVHSVMSIFAPQPAGLITQMRPLHMGLSVALAGVIALYNYMGWQNFRFMVRELRSFGGAFNADKVEGGPRVMHDVTPRARKLGEPTRDKKHIPGPQERDKPFNI